MGMRDDFGNLLKIHNPFNLATYARDHGAPDVFIDFRPYQGGRASLSAAWQVVRPGFKTDPDGHWRDYGHKTFMVYETSQREAKLAEAIAWASARYGITEWVKGPTGFGGTYYVPRATYDLVMADLKAARKAAGPRAPKSTVKVYSVESRNAFIGPDVVRALGLDHWIRQGDIYVSAPTKAAALEALEAAGHRTSPGSLRQSESFFAEEMIAQGVFDGSTKVIVTAGLGRGNGNVLQVEPGGGLRVIGRAYQNGGKTEFAAAPSDTP